MILASIRTFPSDLLSFSDFKQITKKHLEGLLGGAWTKMMVMEVNIEKRLNSPVTPKTMKIGLCRFMQSQKFKSASGTRQEIIIC